MHEEIKGFSEEGIIADDSIIISQKEHFQRILENKMRLYGYIPHLDLNVGWTTHKREDGPGYAFKITMYGIFVGEDKECEKIGYSDGKIILIR